MLVKLLVLLMFVYLVFLIGLGVFMFFARFRAVKTKKIHPSYFKTYQADAPDHLKVMENHYNNQFQVPVLFFIANLVAMQTQSVSGLYLTLACLFFISRMAHSYIHLGSNIVMHRAGTFFFGILTLLGLWIAILINIF